MWLKKIKARRRAKTEYEAAIKWICERESLTLAIAHMEHFLGYNVAGSEGGGSVESPAGFVMHGTILLPDAWERKVLCQVQFDNHRLPDKSLIGACFLRHYEEAGSTKAKRHPEERPFRLEAGISDPDRIWRHHVFDELQRAAISGRSFVRIEIGKASLDPDRATREMRGSGRAQDTMKIRHMKMWPSITLPKAPEWMQRSG